MKTTKFDIDYAQEVLRRRDMRDILTFTIDPATAKDFDDAISFERLPVTDDGLQEYQIGVHIADVSFFVPYGSDLDERAYERGNSTYLVDQVIPMLPEELSNDLCSLMPNEDRLCMSVIFTMDAEAQVIKHKICRTVIHSDARLNYDEAQQIIEGQHVDIPVSRYNDLSEALLTINALALKLRKARMANGALDIEQEEPHFRLDDNGHPVEIYFEQPNEAHHLIEEFMLLANRTVAAEIGNRPFIYRVHDKPDPDKLADIDTFKSQFKHQPSEITHIIDLLMIRAQAKAVYSTNNIGHYGLRFPYYTHFTSPIRRYPDLMVHRLVAQYILKGKPASYTKQELDTICEHCSNTEQAAQLDERDSIKYFQTLWMTDHVGEILDGHIVSVTDFGVFVRLDESRCEGLVHIHQLCHGEYMAYDEKHHRLVSASNKVFTLGDPLRVQVVKADIYKSQIDFIPAEQEE
ncbi:MAG: RNB domain-containing ribonuclease [Paludibacteraceae bacterium]|nr:RNB domain-containing ribonuclease [Paludibacteraceae bacterium]